VYLQIQDWKGLAAELNPRLGMTGV